MRSNISAVAARKRIAKTALWRVSVFIAMFLRRKLPVEGNLEEFIPFLVPGEVLHVGGKTTFGPGKYEIVDDAKHYVSH